MAFPPLVPTFYCCTQCKWEEAVKSDVLTLFPCPKCGATVVITHKKKRQNWLSKLLP